MKTAPMSKFRPVVSNSLTLAEELLLYLPDSPAERVSVVSGVLAAANSRLLGRPVELRHLNQDLVLAFDGQKMTFCVPELQVAVPEALAVLKALGKEMYRAIREQIQKEQADALAQGKTSYAPDESAEPRDDTLSQPNEGTVTPKAENYSL